MTTPLWLAIPIVEDGRFTVFASIFGGFADVGVESVSNGKEVSCVTETESYPGGSTGAKEESTAANVVSGICIF